MKNTFKENYGLMSSDEILALFPNEEIFYYDRLAGVMVKNNEEFDASELEVILSMFESEIERIEGTLEDWARTSKISYHHQTSTVIYALEKEYTSKETLDVLAEFEKYHEENTEKGGASIIFCTF